MPYLSLWMSLGPDWASFGDFGVPLEGQSWWHRDWAGTGCAQLQFVCLVLTLATSLEAFPASSVMLLRFLWPEKGVVHPSISVLLPLAQGDFHSAGNPPKQRWFVTLNQLSRILLFCAVAQGVVWNGNKRELMRLIEIPPRFPGLVVIPSADLWPLDDAVHLSGRIPSLTAGSKCVSDNNCRVLGMLQHGRSSAKTANDILSGEEMGVKGGGCESVTSEGAPQHKYRPFEGVLCVFLTFYLVKGSPNEGGTERGVGWGTRSSCSLKCVPRDWTPWWLWLTIACPISPFSTMNLGIDLAPIKRLQGGAQWLSQIGPGALPACPCREHPELPHGSLWTLKILFLWVFMRCFGTFPSLFTSRVWFHTL